MDFLAFFAAGACAYKAYELYKAAPIDLRAWAITAGWGLAALGAFIAGF